ncbi:MAG TPA: transposase, partial [Thermomicrobiales bacterium]|nr:transposase [Thermomicrobiales bacterium]
DGHLFQLVREQALRGEGVVGFLRHLLRHLPGKLPVIWDGAPVHRSRVVKQFLREDAAGRRHLEHLPGYAPGLNADEGIGDDLKRVELRNGCCHDLAELRRERRRAMERLRHKRPIIQGCVRQAGYL